MRATGSIAGLGATLRLLVLGCLVGLATGPVGCGRLAVGGPLAPASAVAQAPAVGAGDDWPTYGGDAAGTRYSRLDRIDRGNVGRLRRVWTYHTGIDGVFEATPVVVGGAMYLATPVADGRQRVIRLDADTGEARWVTELRVRGRRAEPVRANRGVAVHRGRVYVATLDAELVALDADTGDEVWRVRTSDPAAGHQHKQAPLAHDGRIYLGVSGGPLGIRGWVKCFDAADGREIWTWHTIPSPEEGGWWGEWVETLPGTDIDLGRDIGAERADSARTADSWRRGGAAMWMTPTLDVERGLLFVSIGNPAPELTDHRRPGDNRWSVSVCALRADDGSMAWCDQYLPHDVWGMDAASPPFLFTHVADDAGAGAEPAVGHFSKLGLFYAWNRETGERLTLSENYVPHRNFLARPTEEGVVMAPGLYGGTEWSPAAWSPETGIAYAPSLHAPGRYFVRADGSHGFDLLPRSERHGLMVAMDPVTGQVAWSDRVPQPMVGGALVTAGGLVFAGRLSGRLTAWDAFTGERLWSADTGAGCASGPVTYRVDGRQYVAIAAGGHFLGGATGDVVVVFGLPESEEP